MKKTNHCNIKQTPGGVQFDWIENEVPYTRYISFNQEFSKFKKEFHDFLKSMEKKGFIKVKDPTLFGR